MPQAIISARVDSSDKFAFNAFCRDAGITASSAIKMFIKTVLREQRFPFPIESDSFDSDATK